MARLLGSPRGVAPWEPAGEHETAPLGTPPGAAGAELTPGRLTALVRHLRGRGPALRDLGVAARIDGLSRAAALLQGWLTESAVPLAPAPSMTELAAVTGYSPPVVRQGLHDLWGAITAPELERWWARDGGSGRADLAVVIAAGNIPGVAVFPIVAGLLAGVPTLAKVSGEEPLVAAWWHQALEIAAPELADALAVALWSGGEAALENVACAAADRVLVFGSDATVAALSSRYGLRVSGFGTGLSLAVIGPGAEPMAAAEGIARDLAIWDQQGCLSPRGVFVVGDATAAVEFGRALSRALELITPRLPPGRWTPAEAAVVRHFRADREAWAIAGANTRLWTSGRSLDWTVSVEAGTGFQPSCTGRTLRIWPIAGPAELEEEVAAWRHQLQGVALAAGEAEGVEWRQRLGDMGFSHVTEPGRLQSPPVDWRNRRQDLLRVLLGPPS